MPQPDRKPASPRKTGRHERFGAEGSASGLAAGTAGYDISGTHRVCRLASPRPQAR